jgi:hypothetical protein
MISLLLIMFFLLFVGCRQLEPTVADRKETNSNAGTSSHNFSKSVTAPLQKRNSSNSWLFPGIVVWAKRANNEWWPAEV